MGYQGFMGCGVQIPVHPIGGPKKVWGIRGYGLPKAWVMRESTVTELVDAENSWVMGCRRYGLGQSRL